MHDDDFDRRLALRLRAYESRLPEADAPPEGGLSRRRRYGWPLLVTGAAAVVAGALLAVLLVNRPEPPVGNASPPASPSPSASASASISSGPNASAVTTPAASESVTPSAPVSSLDWSSTAAFAGDGGPSMVRGVAAADSGLVAIGVSYRSQLPNVGPTPLHRARVWTSPDGRSWSEVALGDAFENVSMEHLIVRADGSLLALGHRATAVDGMISDAVPEAWASADGQSWATAESGLPRAPSEVTQGTLGYLALLPPVGVENEQQLWYSEDGFTWEAVRTLASGLVKIGAGDEGFVAVGRLDNGADGQPLAIASGDGRAWFDAAAPPVGAAAVAPLGPDWVAVSAFTESVPNGRVWFSANGLEWEERGDVPLAPTVFGTEQCGEYPGKLSTAGGWLVVDGEYQYPCSEGGFAVHGSQWISADGMRWARLPFETGTQGETRSGAAVLDAIEAEAGLVLVGEEDGQAAFWLGDDG